MADTSSSPKLHNLKKSQVLSTSNLHKQKAYLPSRYAHEKIANKNDFHDVLNSIESNLKTTELDKLASIQPKALLNSPQKIKRGKEIAKVDDLKVLADATDFRAKPLKRVQSDMLNFKEIFIEPRQEVLKKIQEIGKQTNLNQSKQIAKQYDKLLQFQNGAPLSPTKSVAAVDKVEDVKEIEMSDHFNECIQILEQNPEQKGEDEEDFYEEQIRIEPPDLPNSSIASTLTRGSGYAPSIPLNAGTLNKQQGNLKELLMRAKAGMNIEDIQKQAHLSFFLGMVYEQKKQYISALKFYRRYLGFAKAMEDKIGMSLGANRVAINYYYHGDVNKSIAFHNQNLKLSDSDNCFAGFYNLGICYRKLDKLEESIEHFETALQWACQRGEMQSQCITYGQLAVTYSNMQLYQQSLQNFEKSLDYCRKLKKVKLQLYNLRNILRITSQFELKSLKNILQVASQAYQCADNLQDKTMLQIFGCNIGIIQGKQRFIERKSNQMMEDEIEQVYDDVQ